VTSWGSRGIRVCCFSWWRTWLIDPRDLFTSSRHFHNVLEIFARCAEMGANARRIAIEEYSLELQARLYASVV
jgi:hypothetical protein